MIGECQPRHRHQEFLRFLERINQSIDAELDVHLVLDNYGTHTRPEVRKWLRRKAPLSHSFHTDRLILAESDRTLVCRDHPQENPPCHFRSVRELTRSIHEYIRIYNNNPRPFQCVASASRIIRKVNKYRNTLEIAG